MMGYATAVTASLIAITLVSIHLHEQIKHHIHEYEHLLPKISAGVLVVLAVSFLI